MARALGALPPGNELTGQTSEEREPLLSGPDPGGGLPKFGTAPERKEDIAAWGSDQTLLEKQRELLGEEEFFKRRNEWSAALQLGNFVPPLSLRQRRENWRTSPDKAVVDRGICGDLCRSLSAGRGGDGNPVLRESLKTIKQTFGSGVAAYFYDWRWLIMLNLIIWAIWFGLVILVWLWHPPRFSDSNPPGVNFWSRDDLDFGMIFGGTDTKKTKALQDSFFFYTGYKDKMGAEGKWPMGPVWVACIIGTCIILFSAINQRLIAALKKRQTDPDVYTMVYKQEKEADVAGSEVGKEAGMAIFGWYEHGSHTPQGHQGTSKAIVTKLESLVAGKYSAKAYPIDLTMGKEVFQIRCRVDEAAKSMQEKFKAGEATAAESVLNHNTVYRRKLAPGIAHEVADDDTLTKCVNEYVKANPEAAEFAISDNEKGGDAKIALVTGNRVAQKATACILKFGHEWKIKHASKQVERMGSNEWKPTHSWLDCAEKHKGEMRPACVFVLQHGENVSATSRVKQAFGIFATLICFGISGTGVYMVTQHGEAITKIWAYGNTVLLVLIQTVVPIVVKLIVKLENWSSDEMVMRWTLGRVYILKMANLVVLLFQLSSLGQKEHTCGTMEAGLYLYNLVVTGALMSMAINFFSFWGMYRFGGRERVDFDHQTVAQCYIELNYNAALCWIGIKVSPMLPLVAALLGYMELKWMGLILKWFCKCSDNPFQATPQTKMLIMMIFLGTFGFTCWPICLFLYSRPNVLYAVHASVKYKSYCGPIIATGRRYEVFLNFLLGWCPTLEDALKYAANPLILVGVVAILAVLVAYNYEATDMVRQECASAYLDTHNSTKHLRQRRIQANILQREKEALEVTVAQLNRQVVDLEAGAAQLRDSLSEEQKKQKKGGMFSRAGAS